jgi:hypothetical protein
VLEAITLREKHSSLWLRQNHEEDTPLSSCYSLVQHEDLKSQRRRDVTPRRPQDQGRQHIGSIHKKFLFPSISAQPQGRTTGYRWIFISPMKLRFQRIKNQVNRRFLQVGMAELPKVARSEISGQQARAETKRP